MRNTDLSRPILLTVMLSLLGCSQKEIPVARATSAGTDNPVPPEEAFNSAISVSGLPDDYECRVLGEIREGKQNILEWKVPGKVAFDVSLPCEEPLEIGNLRTSIAYDKKGDPIFCSSGTPTAHYDSGQLHLKVEHAVSGFFDTNDKCILKVDEFRDGIRHELGRMEVPIRFVRIK